MTYYDQLTDEEQAQVHRGIACLDVYGPEAGPLAESLAREIIASRSPSFTRNGHHVIVHTGGEPLKRDFVSSHNAKSHQSDAA